MRAARRVSCVRPIKASRSTRRALLDPNSWLGLEVARFNLILMSTYIKTKKEREREGRERKEEMESERETEIRGWCVKESTEEISSPINTLRRVLVVVVMIMMVMVMVVGLGYVVLDR